MSCTVQSIETFLGSIRPRILASDDRFRVNTGADHKLGYTCEIRDMARPTPPSYRSPPPIFRFERNTMETFPSDKVIRRHYHPAQRDTTYGTAIRRAAILHELARVDHFRATLVRSLDLAPKRWLQPADLRPATVDSNNEKL